MSLTGPYDAEVTPPADAFRDPKSVKRFEKALRGYLARTTPGQPPAVLAERVKLHSMLEELLASPGSKTLRQGMARLCGEGLSRAAALDALVALAASFHGADDDVNEQMRFLQAVGAMTRAIAESTFAEGPGPVIEARLKLRPKA